MASEQALRGDPDAAWNLVLYFSGDNYDKQRNEYWYQIAIDDRSPNALAMLGEKLGTSDDPCVAIRGIYYLGLALRELPSAQGEPARGWRLELDGLKDRARTITSINCLEARADLR